MCGNTWEMLKAWNNSPFDSIGILQKCVEKSRIRKTKHLSTDVYSSTAAKKLLSIFLSLPAAIAAAAAKGLLRNYYYYFFLFYFF